MRTFMPSRAVLRADSIGLGVLVASELARDALPVPVLPVEALSALFKSFFPAIAGKSEPATPVELILLPLQKAMSEPNKEKAMSWKCQIPATAIACARIS